MGLVLPNYRVCGPKRGRGGFMALLYIVDSSFTVARSLMPGAQGARTPGGELGATQFSGAKR